MSEQVPPAQVCRIWLTEEQTEICWGTSAAPARLSTAELRFVGEYTTAAGPWQDDWFVVFGAVGPRLWHVPMGEPGQAELLVELGGVLQAPLVGGLAHSTQWCSRLIWPSTLPETELFYLGDRKKAGGLWERLVYWATGQAERELCLSAAAVALLR